MYCSTATGRCIIAFVNMDFFTVFCKNNTIYNNNTQTANQATKANCVLCDDYLQQFSDLFFHFSDFSLTAMIAFPS